MSGVFGGGVERRRGELHHLHRGDGFRRAGFLHVSRDGSVFGRDLRMPFVGDADIGGGRAELCFGMSGGERGR